MISDGKGKKWLISMRENGQLHTHHGIVKHSDIVNSEFGDPVTTHLGKTLWILYPTLHDLIMKITRKTQIIYPKDIGFMLVYGGIRSGYNVIEIGTGSGALTTALAYIVKPNGIIDTYEKRRDFITLAKNNLKKYGLDKYVNFHNIDFLEADVKEEFYDAAFIDIDSPWLAVPKVWKALKGGRTAFFIIPTYSQLEKIATNIHRYFMDVVGFETSIKEILIRPGKIRPPFRMIGYTAVVVTGRKKSLSTDEENI